MEALQSWSPHRFFEKKQTILREAPSEYFQHPKRGQRIDADQTLQQTFAEAAAQAERSELAKLRVFEEAKKRGVTEFSNV